MSNMYSCIHFHHTPFPQTLESGENLVEKIRFMRFWKPWRSFQKQPLGLRFCSGGNKQKTASLTLSFFIWLVWCNDTHWKTFFYPACKREFTSGARRFLRRNNKISLSEVWAKGAAERKRMQPLYGISRHNQSRSEQWQTVYWSKPSDLHIPAPWHNGDDINRPPATSQSTAKWHRETNLKHTKKSNTQRTAMRLKTQWLHHQTLLSSWCQETLCKAGASLFPAGQNCSVSDCCQSVVQACSLYIYIYSLCSSCLSLRLFIWLQDKTRAESWKDFKQRLFKSIIT